MLRRLVWRLRAQAFKRGVIGSSANWLAAWVGLGLASFLYRRLVRETAVVERWVLRPGDTIQIRDTGIAWAEIEALEQ